MGSPTPFRLYFYFMEIWKEVKGYENQYEVSNFGNVKSVDRYVNHWRGGESLMKGRVLKLSINSCGYFVVVLSNSNITKTFYVHQLVAIAFLNHKLCGYEVVVDHKDFNRLNNNLSNLSLVSARANVNQKHLPSNSDYTGVHRLKNSNKFQSHIVVKNKKKHLGTFDSEYDAHLAYEKALSEINN